MEKINKENYQLASELFASVDWELSAKAVIYGYNPGEIYVDDLLCPNFGIILTPEGAIIGGNINSNFERFEDWVNVNFIHQRINNQDKYFILYFEPLWEEHIKKFFNKRPLVKEKRFHYYRNLVNYKPLSINLPEGMKLEQVSKTLIENHLTFRNMDHVKNWVFNNWGNYDNFQKYGFGVVIIHKDIIVSWSVADCKYKHECEIGIHTDNEYRKQGFATKTITAMLNLSYTNDYHTVGWHCASDNIASYKTAETCGFLLEREYFGYYGGFDEIHHHILLCYNLLYKQKSLDKAKKYFDTIQEVKFESHYLYDFACGFALLKCHKYAFQYLCKAIRLGFNNKNHILNDKNLSFLHQFDEWKEVKKSL